MKRIKSNSNPKIIFKWIYYFLLCIKVRATTILIALNTNKEWTEYISFDTDGVNFAIDNYTNVKIYNLKECFEELEPIIIPLNIRIVGEKAMPKGIGIIRL